MTIRIATSCNQLCSPCQARLTDGLLDGIFMEYPDHSRPFQTIPDPKVLRVVFHYRKYALPVVYLQDCSLSRVARPRGALRTSRLLLGGGRWGESLGLDGEWWILVGSTWVFWFPTWSLWSLNVPIEHHPTIGYMVNAMATFSGDVQYSQNGTVTNPWWSLWLTASLCFLKLVFQFSFLAAKLHCFCWLCGISNVGYGGLWNPEGHREFCDLLSVLGVVVVPSAMAWQQIYLISFLLSPSLHFLPFSSCFSLFLFLFSFFSS